MKLSAVANKFNTMPCVDAYTGQHAFYGQLDLADDNKRDSVTAERRVISTAPGVTIPARRVVTAAGTRFILGSVQPDWFKGSVIRQGIVAHEAPFLCQIQTLSDACASAPGTSAYSNRVWVKNFAYTEQTSLLVPEYQVYFALGEPVETGCVLTVAGEKHLVRSVNEGPSGTLIALSEVLPGTGYESGFIETGSYNVVTETRNPGSALVGVIRMRWQSQYQYKSTIAPKFGPDDIQVAITKSALTLVPGLILTLSDGLWKLEAVADESGVWLCRATRHAGV